MDNLINSITSTSDSGITLTLSMAIVAMAGGTYIRTCYKSYIYGYT